MINVILGEQRQDYYEEREKLENHASINDGKSYATVAINCLMSFAKMSF